VKKKAMMVGMLMVSLSGIAKNVIDVHGEQGVAANQIIQKYGADIGRAIDDAFKNYMTVLVNDKKSGQSASSSPHHSKQYFIDHIKKEGGYAFVDIQTTVYPDDKNIYSTIEVIKKNQPSRLRFVQHASQKEQSLGLKKKRSNKPDLIDQRLAFDKLEFQLIQSNQIDLKVGTCPVFHCVTNYTHPKLKPYLTLFNQGAVKERQFILATLNKDPDPNRRAAAAFLVGHFKDPKEIIAVLTPHINDPAESVRNNVMRVIGTTLMLAKLQADPVDPYLEILNSPYGTDRNKALNIILESAGSPKANQAIIDHGGDYLISLLRLKQPNNHEPAYYILKKVSGKNFGEHDIVAWQRWLNSARSKNA
jgi:hypothetical protein